MSKKEEPESESNCLYFDISKQERDSAIRYLLGAIIKSRKDGNFPSNYYTYDEDVNIYMAHLLFAVSLPEYREMAEPYLSVDTSDILRWVRATEDRTIRYFIFKVNADHLLIHSSIFDDLNHRPSQKIFKRSQKHFAELAKLYYDQAAAYHKRIYRRRTGVGEVLEKLSHYFEAYQGLLKVVRREYFSFVTSFRDQAFHHFMNEMKTFERDMVVKEKMDHFLALYAQWIDTRNPRVAKEIEYLAREMEMLDPTFRFDKNKLSFGEEGYGDERKCA
ncbi:MAG: hypothetical protein HYZ85_04535 [Candidatus Omnitrophica bacterium]|nr:hypothetical protein [Candidatus Omnitrophota bacterium]